MSIIKKLRWKDKSGKTTDYDLGAKASNVEQDSTHRFVSDTEKQTWNGKANPGDIPSGSAANYGVANNDTTNRSDQLVTAQVAYQHGKEIDQLISEIDKVGTIYDAVIAETTIGSNVLTNVCNKWLEKGVYFINTQIRANLSEACNFEQFILVGDTQDPRGSSSLVLGAGNNASNIGFIIEIKDTSRNVVLQVRQYSPESVFLEGWMFITRIK